MKHARQKIREGFAAALAGIAEIHTTRVYPMINLPVISVYGNSEASDSENEQIGSPRVYSRNLTISVDITTEAVAGVDDEIDDLSAQAESALGADVTIAGTCIDSKLINTTLDFSGEADTPLAVCKLQYMVWYRTTAADPESTL